MKSFEQNVDVSGIENEIAIFESFRLTALELGLTQAESQLSQEVTTRRLAIIKVVKGSK